MKRPWISVLIGSIVLLELCGCGASAVQPAASGVNTNTANLSAGNWLLRGASMPSDSSTSICPVYLRGALSSSEGNVTGVNDIRLASSSCGSTPSDLGSFAVSGVIDGGSLSLTTPDLSASYLYGKIYSGAVLSIDGALDSTTHFGGTYSRTAGSKAVADSGVIDGVLVASISGSWSGTITSSSSATRQIELSSLVQSSTAAVSGGMIPAGAFPLSGALIVHNLSCFYDGVIDSSQSYILGDYIKIYSDGGGATLTLNLYLPGPSTATMMTIVTGANATKAGYPASGYSGGGTCSSESGSSGTLIPE